MREILFRGKSVLNLGWLFGNFLKTDEGVFVIQNPDPFGGLEKYEVDHNTICQYTGLEDKNGKKIFDGDIVKMNSGRICKIIWFSSPQYQGWDLIPLEVENPKPTQYNLWSELEVIGNLFDGIGDSD